MDEGYIKFRYKVIEEGPPDLSILEDIINLRTKLFDLRLIGVKRGVSYGNLSKRIKGNEFIITASNTGHIRVLEPIHFAIINSVQLEANYIEYSGKMPPSSETLTHFAIYFAFKNTSYVVHFHNLKIWEKLINNVPTTPVDKAYGTVELARAIIDIRNEFQTESSSGIIALGGHKEGIIVFGNSVEFVLKEIGKLINE